ncbi:hypothetical protein MaudCBS49596_005918 [Microsporum audouinii]
MGRVDGNSELYDILSNFMTQDKSFLFSRNFSRLNIKNLLWMQDGLIELEKELIQAKSTDNAQHEGSQDDIIRLRKLIAETGGRKVRLPKGGSLYIFDNSMVRRALRAAVTTLIWKVVYHSNVFESGYHA